MKARNILLIMILMVLASMDFKKHSLFQDTTLSIQFCKNKTFLLKKFDYATKSYTIASGKVKIKSNYIYLFISKVIQPNPDTQYVIHEKNKMFDTSQIIKPSIEVFRFNEIIKLKCISDSVLTTIINNQKHVLNSYTTYDEQKEY